MNPARVLPMIQLMPAAGSRNPLPPPHSAAVDGPKRMSGRTLSPARAGHPIHHHVAGDCSVHPDKAGRRHVHPHQQAPTPGYREPPMR